MAGSIGSLSAKLSLDASNMLAGLHKIEGRLGSFAAGLSKLGSLASSALGGLGVGVSFSAFTDAVKATIDDAGRLTDISSKLGLGVGSLEQLELAAKTSGVEANTLHNAIGKLQQKIGEAARGEAEAVKDFQALGLSWRELAAASPDEQFTMVATKIGSMTEAFQRADAANNAFGKTGRDLIPLLRDFQSEMDLAGKSLSKLSDESAQKLDAMGDAWERLKAKASSAFREILVSTAELLENGPGGKPRDMAGEWFKAFDSGSLEKQLSLAKEFAEMDHLAKLGAGLIDRVTRKPMLSSDFVRLSEGNTWEQQVAALEQELGQLKSDKLGALQAEGLQAEFDAFTKVWQKWADDAAKDARTASEIIEEGLDNLQMAWDFGFIKDKGAFERIRRKITGEDKRDAELWKRAEEAEAGLRSPLETFAATQDKLGELEKFLAPGALAQLRGKGLLDLEKSLGGLANRGDVGAMAKGSVEAGSVINRFLNDAGRQRDPQQHVPALLEQMKRLHELQVDLQERMAEAFEALAVG